MKKAKDSEVRLYGFILDKLKELGWDTRSPKNGGQVYAQNELRYNEQLKIALGLLCPEYIVELSEREYWVIEAKAAIKDLYCHRKFRPLRNIRLCYNDDLL
ncbi:hypothetical protein F4Y59_09075 [Candidatus Poribacteria bacterium]|nr:hypothetical protein [Candidatus Poribacteria bacterium]MYK18461.1 hypothetical protein [Candidatus Poribacteria bacterium]